MLPDGISLVVRTLGGPQGPREGPCGEAGAVAISLQAWRSHSLVFYQLV